jgi:hypothetical protein
LMINPFKMICRDQVHQIMTLPKSYSGKGRTR